MTRLGLLAVLIVGTGLSLVSQALRFEVASIKPAPKDIAVPTGAPAPDRFYRSNIELLNLINYAFDMRAFRIFGAEGWASTDEWEVSAKADRPLNLAEMRAMVRQLMADRFGLKIHRETRELPIYHLVVARDDKRLARR